MRGKFRKREMLTATNIQQETRRYLAALVEREQRQGNSRMFAYQRVSALLGVSSDWIQRIIGRQDRAVEAHTFFNVREAYERLCMRIERAADQKEHQNAAIASDLSMVTRGIRAPSAEEET